MFKKVLGIIILIVLFTIPAIASNIGQESLLNNVYDSVNNRLNVNVIQSSGTNLNATVDLNPGSSVISDQLVVVTAGTELPLSPDTAILSVTVKAKHANANMIYVGKNPVTSSTGFVLDAGESITIDTDNLTDIYIDADTGGDGVSYLAIIY